ncbi:MAG: NAD(P)/FAD-dependent oxidoreductase, partial [Candidatus Scalindua sp.]
MQENVRKSVNEKVLIIGGGPAGLTAAYELSKSSVDAIVFEKDKVVGGISKTVNYKDYYFDLGGHRFFTKIQDVEDIWKEVLGDDLLHRNRLSRIYYNKKFFNYPLRPLNALTGLGLWNTTTIMCSYLCGHLFPSKEEETFEQWVSNRFGKRLYQIFFKTYTEKVWGIPCSEIKAEWAAQRIKGLSLVKAIKNAMIKPENTNKKEVIKTLIDSFDYPKFGPGLMYQTMSKSIQNNGSQVQMESEVNAILWNKNHRKVESLEVNVNGQEKLYHGTDFISTMPIRELIQKFKPSVPEEVLKAANGLNYRDFLTVVLIIDKRDVFPDNWIYIHEPDVKLGRIQNYKNWSPHMVPDPDKTCLGLEYFCFEGDDLWTMPNRELIELGKRELEILGFAEATSVEDATVVRVPKAYPVYDLNYKCALNIVCEFLDGIDNLQLIGRNGMHRYNNMDHSMLTAIYAARNINGANHNLWEVNEEQEYLEEKVEELADDATLDEYVGRTFSKMYRPGFAIAMGTVSGLLILVATLFLVLKG